VGGVDSLHLLCILDLTASAYFIISFIFIFQLPLLEGFVQLELIPSVIQKGNKIQIIDLPSLKIRFLSAAAYLQGSIYDMAAQYQIQSIQHFFPDSWNQKENYNYNGKIPELNDFFSFTDTPAERIKIKNWYETQSSHWILKQELIETLENETLAFTKSMLCFLKQSFELQDKLGSIVSEIPSAIHPFGWNVSSLSNFTYAVYCFYYMNKYEVFSVMNPYSNSASQSSAGEYEYIRYQFH